MPQKGRVKCSPQTNTEQKQPNSMHSSPTRRVQANETSEFRNLAQTYTTLAENEEWMAVHLDQDGSTQKAWRRQRRAR